METGQSVAEESRSMTTSSARRDAKNIQDSIRPGWPTSHLQEPVSAWLRGRPQAVGAAEGVKGGRSLNS